jgi:hypothetical protein
MSPRLPSVRTLRAVFNDNAKQARAILEMNREQLEKLPTPQALVMTYHPPHTSQLRLCLLDELAGTHGVEAFEVRGGTWCEYLNAGDTYALTLILFRGAYRVACWGDIAERCA